MSVSSSIPCEKTVRIVVIVPVLRWRRGICIFASVKLGMHIDVVRVKYHATIVLRANSGLRLLLLSDLVQPSKSVHTAETVCVHEYSLV